MVPKFLKNLARDRKGQGMVEYGILVAGVALVALVGVSVLGHKTAGMVSTVAAILPGTEATDSGAIVSGSLIETKQDGGGGTAITIDPTNATDGTHTDRLDGNTGLAADGTGTSVLALDPTP